MYTAVLSVLLKKLQIAKFPVPVCTICTAFHGDAELVRERDEPVAAPILGVVSAGEVASTLLPVPVLATLTRFLLASVATADDAVSPGILIRPPDLIRMAVKLFGARKISVACPVWINAAPDWNAVSELAKYTLVELPLLTR